MLSLSGGGSLSQNRVAIALSLLFNPNLTSYPLISQGDLIAIGCTGGCYLL
ncbi:MAG: hypothetical protein AB8B99_08225 [Phormidesmis sp.]